MALVEGERLFRLAKRFEKMNTPRSLARAVGHVAEAAHLGHLQSIIKYATCHEFGIVVMKNPKRALSWYLKASDSGCTMVWGRILGLIQSGECLGQTIVSVEHCYERGVEVEDPFILATVGHQRIYGGDLPGGLSLLNRSIALGSNLGLSRLGAALCRGNPVSRDVEKGLSFMIGAMRGFEHELLIANRSAMEFRSFCEYTDFAGKIGVVLSIPDCPKHDLISAVRHLRVACLLPNRQGLFHFTCAHCLLDLREFVGAQWLLMKAARLGERRAVDVLDLYRSGDFETLIALARL